MGEVYHCTGSSVPFDLEREAYVIISMIFLGSHPCPVDQFWCNNFEDSGLPSTKGGGGDIGGL